MVGLHFFEPRYRLLVKRAMTEERANQFIFLPNYASYTAAHGDIGFLTTIVDYSPVPVANANELPRADVKIRFDMRVLLLFHWMESDTGGLTECLCTPIPPDAPLPELAWPSVKSTFRGYDELETALALDKNPGVRILSSSPNQREEGNQHIQLSKQSTDSRATRSPSSNKWNKLFRTKQN